MTGFLASVTGVKEATIALAGGANIIDLKDPQNGALGALPLQTIAETVETIGKPTLCSATIGDLLADSGRVPGAVRALQTTGVDLIKIGFFPGDGNLYTLIDALESEASRHRLVAVLFADLQPDLALLPRLATAGFHGVMLDTATKNGAGLRASLDTEQLTAFVHNARQLGLISGLAGQLVSSDISALLPLNPDYLGFRSALCVAQNRRQAIDARAIKTIRRLIPVNRKLKTRVMNSRVPSSHLVYS